MDYFEEIIIKQKLISELQRFYKENNKVPRQIDMQVKFGYPSYGMYVNHFGSWNKALIEAGLKINQKHQIGTLNGTETCSYCGKRADEIQGFDHWLYPNDIRYCIRHGNSKTGGTPDYVIGNLDINSTVGRGRLGEIIVSKTLGINKEHDCNIINGCNSNIDLYKEEYGKIDVKTSLLNYKYNNWTFSFKAKKEANTYVCIGLVLDKKYIEHVWVVPNEGEIKNTVGITIRNLQNSLSNRKHWEVNAKIYNDAWKEMLVNYTDGKCNTFCKKGE